MVYKGAQFPRSHIVYTVEVGEVDGALVGQGCVFVVFVDVESEEDYVDSVDVLEDDDALASIGEFGWVVFEGVSFVHSFADFYFAFHGGDLADVDGTAYVCGFFWRRLDLYSLSALFLGRHP